MAISPALYNANALCVPAADDYIDGAYLQVSTDPENAANLGSDNGLFAANGPKGDTGPSGPAGPKGPDGLMGPPPAFRAVGTYIIQYTGEASYEIGETLMPGFIVSSCISVPDPIAGDFFLVSAVKVS